MSDGDRYREMIKNRKLSELEPGLIRIDYSYGGNSQGELALILTPSLANEVMLPNDTLDYRDFLRGGMKSAVIGGLKIIGPFYGFTINNKHIDEVNGRRVRLNDSFCDFEKNFNPLLVACNSPYFFSTIDEMKNVLKAEGFNVDCSRWDAYKNWEEERLKTF